MNSLLNEFGRFIGHNPALAFPLALFAGLVSAFSPCVMATVPLIVGYVGGYADDRRRCIRYTLAFCLGRRPGGAGRSMDAGADRPGGGCWSRR